MKIYLVIRLSFDSMENELGSARYQTIEGFATTRAAAEAFVNTRPTQRRREWDGKEYPQWEITEVSELEEPTTGIEPAASALPMRRSSS